VAWKHSGLVTRNRYVYVGEGGGREGGYVYGGEHGGFVQGEGGVDRAAGKETHPPSSTDCRCCSAPRPSNGCPSSSTTTVSSGRKCASSAHASVWSGTNAVCSAIVRCRSRRRRALSAALQDVESSPSGSSVTSWLAGLRFSPAESTVRPCASPRLLL